MDSPGSSLAEPAKAVKEELELARDLMWKFKLQKNNKEILMRLQNAETILREMQQAEILKFEQAQERVIALETKIADLEALKEHDIETRNTWLEELKELKSLVGRAIAMGSEVMPSQRPLDIAPIAIISRIQPIEPREISPETTISSFPEFLSSTQELQLQKNPPRTISADITSVQNIQVPETPRTNIVKDAFKDPESDTTVTEPADVSSASKSTFRVEEKKQRKESAPKRASHKRGGEKSTATTTPQSLKLQLVQGAEPLERYIDKSHTLLQNGRPGSGSSRTRASTGTEIEFIGYFLHGLKDGELKTRIIEELQYEFESRVKRDGRIEVLCEWTDVVRIIHQVEREEEVHS